jgi:prevent-host-death family protein
MKASLTVGARELKTRLGTYLRRVREGQRIVVTERGAPVAELRGVGEGEGGFDTRLSRLEAAGLVCRARRHALAPLRPIRSRGASLAQAVVDDREDRF